MKTAIQEKKTGLRALGFTEITNLLAIKGGDTPPIEKSEVKEQESNKGSGEEK